MSADPYLDPRTGVLRNRLGVAHAEELAEVEAEVTGLRLMELIERPLPGTYDLAHLQAFHRAIFGDIYDWAGELRTVAIARSGLFCLPQHLQSFADDVFGRLHQRDHLRGLDRAAFVDGLTGLFSDVNALHPFREGNGRAQRSFAGQLARGAAHPIRWSDLDRQTNIDASRAA